jgi:hypothetical protein
MLHEAEPLVSDEHRELHHYTSRKGLEGIWNSGFLFATRYDFLNDSSEVVHFREGLTRAVQDGMAGELQRRCVTDPRFVDAIDRAGGVTVVAEEEAKKLIGLLYGITFEDSSFGEGFAVPYIASFCSHERDHEYEKRNGLLSQWRGYGGDERYAIVFCTRSLEALMEQEAKIFVYPALNIGNAIYNDARLDFAQQYARLIELVVKIWVSLGDQGNASPAIDAVFQPFLGDATRMKHRGFAEEREVRIVACPTFKDLDQRMHAASQMVIAPGKRHKNLHYRSLESGRDAPFIRLFDWTNGERLPIRRIIVGPHRNQTALKQQIESLTERTVPVTCSETPFIG